MTKFDITEWSDFARGAVDPEDEALMREHLATASPATRRTVEILCRVAEVGRSDHEDPVPEHAVRIAKAIASVPRRQAAPDRASLWRRLRCAVTFDSLLEPAPAGTRNLEGAVREVVFEADSYRVDLRLEHELEPRSTVVVGQITSGGAARPMSRLPVFVFSGKDEIGQTLTSEYGEFQFEALPREPLELCVVAGEDFLEIPLDVEPGPVAEVRS